MRLYKLAVFAYLRNVFHDSGLLNQQALVSPIGSGPQLLSLQRGLLRLERRREIGVLPAARGNVVNTVAYYGGQRGRRDTGYHWGRYDLSFRHRGCWGECVIFYVFRQVRDTILTRWLSGGGVPGSRRFVGCRGDFGPSWTQFGLVRSPRQRQRLPNHAKYASARHEPHHDRSQRLHRRHPLEDH